jgi:hypothetical protein
MSVNTSIILYNVNNVFFNTSFKFSSNYFHTPTYALVSYIIKADLIIYDTSAYVGV